MDSAMMYDRDFLHREFDERIEEAFSNTEILGAIRSYISNMGNNPEGSAPDVVRLSSGQFSDITIMPIKSTNWLTVIMSGGTSLFNMSYFIPILVTVLVLLFIVALVTSAANYRLIFLPLGKLDRSLGLLRDNADGRVYGLDREDELGELSKTIQDLFTKANVDALTGIYNRRFMENNLDHIMVMLSRSNGLLSVLMLDIDYFKRYNDAYGHDQGDICLKSVAHALCSCVTRASDFTARYGGEEFIAILPNTDETGAHVVAKKLLDNVRALNITHSGNTAAPYVTVSIGSTTGRVVYGHKWEDYVKRADEALYTSKRNGRNQDTFLSM